MRLRHGANCVLPRVSVLWNAKSIYPERGSGRIGREAPHKRVNAFDLACRKASFGRTAEAVDPNVRDGYIRTFIRATGNEAAVLKDDRRDVAM